VRSCSGVSGHLEQDQVPLPVRNQGLVGKWVERTIETRARLDRSWARDLPGGPCSPASGRPEPNPFRDVARIPLHILAETRVRALVYGVDGRLTRYLLDAVLRPGPAQLLWNGLTDQGRPSAAGLYYCRMSAEQSVKDVRIVRVR
jgi:hypothetical protein